jgi:hypothetical protein
MNPRHRILALALVALLMAIGRTAANQPDEKMNNSRQGMLTALGADRPHQILGQEANTFDRFIGTWDCEYANFKDDGTTERSHGQVVFGWILDGRAVQDVWSWVDEDDPKKERKVGTTVRFFDSKAGKWRIVWISPEEGIIKTLAGGREGDRIVLEGTSDDGAAVRWSFNDIRPDSFVWRGEKSRNHGKTWKPTGEYQMRRSKAPVVSGAR